MELQLSRAPDVGLARAAGGALPGRLLASLWRRGLLGLACYLSLATPARLLAVVVAVASRSSSALSNLTGVVVVVVEASDV